MSRYGNYHCPEFDEYCQREARKRKAAKWVGGGIIAILIGLMLGLYGCKPKQVIVEKEKYIYVTKDSVINKDSIIYIPIEVYKDYSSFQDTLFLETSLAKAMAWNDTSNWMLNGWIENKQAIQYKYIEVDKWHTKDSIVEKEVPVPYEVEVIKTRIPWWALITLTWTLLCLVYVGFKIYLKIYKP